jgi:hypothetical protein
MIFLTKYAFFGTFIKASELITYERQDSINLSRMFIPKL